MAYKNKTKMSFYDFKLKAKFIPKEFIIKSRSGRRYAVAVNTKSGFTSWRTLAKAFKP
jgi:hypothetical protein